jgi:catechol 2,3-dioxygenase-like lactoylglutathione lyase family enzyme
MKLKYAIKFVADMDKAIVFHRDKLGLELGFQSPWWTEFATGDTRLALHPANAEHPAGSVQLGYGSEDLDAFYAAREAAGIVFMAEPKAQFGSRIATFLDSEGAACRISG